MKNNIIISVIIPTLDREKVLIDTLTYVLDQNYPEFEIIVVDQSDEVPEKLKKFIQNNPKIRYKHISEKGTSNAKNVGASIAHGGILVFLDDDVAIENKSFLSQHASNYIDPQIGAIGGRVLMKPYRDVSAIREVGKFKYWGLKEVTNFDADFRTPIDHVYGCNQSYRADVFHEVGGFSKVYKGNAHLEEADLSMRVKKTGYKIYFDPKACLKHLYASSGGCRVDDIYRLRYWILHNYAIFYLRNYPKILFPVFYLKEFFWALGSSIKRKDIKMFKNMIKAMSDGIKYYNKLSKKKGAI